MKWFRKKTEAALPPAPAAPEWTPTDQNNWKRFLESSTGNKLIARARAIEYDRAVAACADKVSQGHTAPRAAGFSDAIVWLLSLSRVSRATEATDSRANGESQTTEPGLDDFLARLSP